MKVFVAVVLLLVAVAFAHPDLLENRNKFDSFVAKFNKKYTNDQEKTFRYKIFLSNLARAEQLNAQYPKAKFGVTKFSDLTPAEFKSKYLMTNVNFTKAALPQASVWQPTANVQVPTQFDWNSKGVVTPVYNQEQCGSCWAFSATETIESVWALAGHSLTQLSQQQIVDCDTSDDGCDGGWPYNAYQYVQSAGGQDPLADYPYTAEDGSCQFNPSEVVAKVTGWQYVTQSEDESAMQQFVYTKSPVSVCVDAELWQSYTGGVITNDMNCGNDIDHCVQITGWSVQSGTNVWNVRNSWGADWGEQGYIWVQMGNNNCAIAQVVTVPTV